jgi:putative ABC transport system permease protein
MFVLKMARREFKASWRKFLVAIVGAALGVGAVTGVQGFSRALHQSLLREGRQLIGGDIRIRTSTPLEAGEQRVIEQLSGRGAEISHAIETVSMVGISKRRGAFDPSAAAEGGQQFPGAPVLASLKAVEPGYPFFGTLQLEPNVPLLPMLQDTVVVSRDLLIRLKARVGDQVRIGNTELPIAAVLVKEPDRLASGLEFGPRVLLSHQSLRKAALLGFGSRAGHSYMVRLPVRGLDLDEALRILKGARSPRFRVTDYRDPNPNLSRGLERVTIFLSLTGLMALLVGGLGVTMAMHAYLQQKLDTIAIMKSLGARSGQLLRVYLTQTLLIAAGGGVLGLAAGAAVQLLFPTLLRGLLDLRTKPELHAAILAQGFAIGLLSTTVMVLPSLLTIRHVKAAQIFRRHVQSERARTSKLWLPLVILLVNLIVIGAIAAWLSHSWRRGFGFVGGLVLIYTLLTALGKLLFRFAVLPAGKSKALRYGMANLHRPGSQAHLIFAVIALGVMLTLTIHLLQVSLVRQFVRSAPADFPNLILIGISEQQRPPLWEFLRSSPEVIDAGQPIAAVPARLTSINGKEIQVKDLDEDGKRFARIEFSLTSAKDIPTHNNLISGRWWKGQPPKAEISVGQFAARSLGIRLGDVLEFRAGGQVVQGIATSVRETESIRPGANNQFIFSPEALRGLPVTYVGNVRAYPDKIAKLQSRLFEKLPTVTSINISEILAIIQAFVNRISTLIQFVAAFVLVTGSAILVSSIIASRYRREHETALLKILGATRGKVSLILAMEFCVLGLAGGLAGSILSALLAKFLMEYLLEAEYHFQWIPLAAAVFGTAALTTLTGWLACIPILNRKPLVVLRHE